MFSLSWATLALVIISYIAIQFLLSSVYPLFSALYASVYLRNSTPIKKFSKKNDPTIINTM